MTIKAKQLDEELDKLVKNLAPSKQAEVRFFVEKAVDMAYEKGKADCCVSALGCLCNPIGGCDTEKCPCPDHYAKHEEWLSHLIS